MRVSSSSFLFSSWDKVCLRRAHLDHHRSYRSAVKSLPGQPCYELVQVVHVNNTLHVASRPVHQVRGVPIRRGPPGAAAAAACFFFWFNKAVPTLMPLFPDFPLCSIFALLLLLLPPRSRYLPPRHRGLLLGRPAVRFRTADPKL